MVFPNSNLPANAQPWVRDIQKRVEATETTVKANNINNTARDVQLENSYKRLDTAVNDLIVVQDSLASTILDVNAAATNAQDAIDGLGNLDQATSTYKINAANLTVGTLSGDRISGGTITGTTVQTDNSPNSRITMSNADDSLNFFDNNNTQVGKIRVSGADRAGVLTIEGPATNYSISLSSASTNIYGAGNQIRLQSGAVEVFGATLSAPGFSTSGTCAASSVNATTVNIGTAALTQEGAGRIRSNTGFLSSGPLGVTGNITYVAPTSTGTTYPLYWDISTNLLYRLSSSQRYKTEIQDAVFDYDLLMQAKPKTFKNKQQVDELGSENAEVTYGYIAEELDALGLTDFVVYENDENGNPRPESVNYMSMALASHGILQHQDSIIKSLTARIEALEAK